MIALVMARDMLFLLKKDIEVKQRYSPVDIGKHFCYNEICRFLEWAYERTKDLSTYKK